MVRCVENGTGRACPGGRVGLSATSTLPVGGWVLVMAGVLVRRSDTVPLDRRRGDLAPETQHFEEEESDSVRAFAQLRRLGLGLVTVSHPDFVGLIRIAGSSTHPSNATGGPSPWRWARALLCELSDRWSCVPKQGTGLEQPTSLGWGAAGAHQPMEGERPRRRVRASGFRIDARSPVARPLNDDAVSSHHCHEPGY